jgi:hypothetical protein
LNDSSSSRTPNLKKRKSNNCLEAAMREKRRQQQRVEGIFSNLNPCCYIQAQCSYTPQGAQSSSLSTRRFTAKTFLKADLQNLARLLKSKFSFCSPQLHHRSHMFFFEEENEEAKNGKTLKKQPICDLAN